MIVIPWYGGVRGSFGTKPEFTSAINLIVEHVMGGKQQEYSVLSQYFTHTFTPTSNYLHLDAYSKRLLKKKCKEAF